MIETLGPGGAEVMLANALPLLAPHADVRVRALGGPDTLRTAFQQAGVDVAMLGNGRYADPTLWDRAQQLRRELSDAPADIVHTHLFKATLVGRLLRLTMRRGFQLVTTLHSPDYSHLETPSRARGAARWAVDWASALAANDAIVTVSQAVAADFRTHMGAIGPWGRIEVIHNAIDVERYVHAVDRIDRTAARRALGWSPTHTAVLAIGRLIASKNFGALVDAIVLLRERGIEAVGVVLGDGPERPQLERKAAGLVRFCGTASHAQVLEALVACDIYVQPSRWEAFGMAILEAMAAGRPVVACAVDGIPEVVSHDDTGLLVPEGDVALFADALAELAHDPDRRRQLGEAGRTRARELFDAGTWVARTSALYARLCPPAAVPRP